jgi:predicted nucleotidyltransferase
MQRSAIRIDDCAAHGHIAVTMITIEDLRRDMPDVCKRYRIAHVDAYGSVARNEQSETSDIDLVIEFEEPRRESISKRYFGFLHELEDRYGTRIDVLTERSLRNPYLINSINRDRVRVYG